MLDIFETHAHYHAEQFDEDRDAILVAMHEGFSRPEKEPKNDTLSASKQYADGAAENAAENLKNLQEIAADGAAAGFDAEEKPYRIRTIVDIAAELDSLGKVMELTRKYDFIYGAIGLHPDEIADLTPETEEKIRILLQDPKIVAVGEIGIDYYWNKEARDVQIAGFQKQIDLAVEYGLPIIVHSREAAEDTMNVVKANAAALTAAVRARRETAAAQLPDKTAAAASDAKMFCETAASASAVQMHGEFPSTVSAVQMNVESSSTAGTAQKRPGTATGDAALQRVCPGIIHCYSYSVEHARMYVDMGFMLGIGGVVTYKNAKKLKEVVRAIPLENLVLETDCPYLAPTPFRGKRNDSRLLAFVAEEIAAIKEISAEEVAAATMKNARELFAI